MRLHQPSVLDSSCSSQTKADLQKTEEYARVSNKKQVEHLSRKDLCEALHKVARSASAGPITLEMASVKPTYVKPAPTRTIPVNAVVRRIGNGTIMCDNTKKPLNNKSVVLIGPYADGPHGLCGTREKLMHTANGNSHKGPDGIIYTTLGRHVPYWFKIEDTEIFSEPDVQAFGIREDRRLSDGSVLAGIVRIRDAKEMAEFLSDPARLLLTSTSPRVATPTEFAPKWATAGQGTARHLPFTIDPLGHEGEICVNDISWITRQKWVDGKDKDRVAIYIEGQRINPGVRETLRAYCFSRENLLTSMNSTIFYRWSNTPQRSLPEFPLYKMPYPAYFLDKSARKLLGDQAIHSYVLRYVDTSTVGTRSSAHEHQAKIFTLIPIRNETDVSREFMS